ncbi:MAG: CapA family protein, partial [Hyphomicrobiaceae bacterium]
MHGRLVKNAAHRFAKIAISWQTALAASCMVIGGVTPQSANAEGPRQLTLVIGGDLGLGGSRQRVDPRGARRHGQLYPWKELTRSLETLIDGDVNFANLESIVTSRNTLRAARKTFVFRSHPVGVQHLVEIGFNLLSTANNHVRDYGANGMRETLAELEKLRPHGLLAFPGLGQTREDAGGPSAAIVRGHTLLISAIGIGGPRPTETRPGILGYRAGQDFDEAVSRLSRKQGSYRMLSVHYGRERSIRPRTADFKKLRDQAVRDNGIDLVIGHHAHVARGVQLVNGRLIFYGLGNLLHPGMQNMAKFGLCQDYGLLAKLHLVAKENDRLSAKAIEVWPLEQMHLKSRRMSGKAAKRRLAVLNSLASELDDAASGARGVQFRAREDGSGLACLSGAAESDGRIGELCRSWAALASPTEKSRTARCKQRRYARAGRVTRNYKRRSKRKIRRRK